MSLTVTMTTNGGDRWTVQWVAYFGNATVSGSTEKASLEDAQAYTRKINRDWLREQAIAAKRAADGVAAARPATDDRSGASNSERGG